MPGIGVQQVSFQVLTVSPSRGWTRPGRSLAGHVWYDTPPVLMAHVWRPSRRLTSRFPSEPTESGGDETREERPLSWTDSVVMTWVGDPRFLVQLSIRTHTAIVAAVTSISRTTNTAVLVVLINSIS